MTVWASDPAARGYVSSKLKEVPSYIVSFISSYLGVLGMICFAVAGFLLNVIVGFVVLGVVLLIMDKAVKHEASDS